jgi:hypothetical protein
MMVLIISLVLMFVLVVVADAIEMDEKKNNQTARHVKLQRVNIMDDYSHHTRPVAKPPYHGWNRVPPLRCPKHL